MPHFDDAETDDHLDEPALTRDAITPRGGFMARPGLKAPPRHAVVIRGGDVEPSENIPLARGSQPPPAPVSPPPAVRSDEQVTLRVIPTHKSEVPTQLDLTPPRHIPVESLPPPSDMPVVASVPAPDLEQPRARRQAHSRWTIVAAAAAGLLLGLASIVATRVQGAAESRPAGAPAMPAEALAPAVPSPRIAAEAPKPAALSTDLEPAASPGPLPSASTEAQLPVAPAAQQAPAAPESARPAGAKRSIF
jgi:hypothetical protein